MSRIRCSNFFLTSNPAGRGRKTVEIPARHHPRTCPRASCIVLECDVTCTNDVASDGIGDPAVPQMHSTTKRILCRVEWRPDACLFVIPTSALGGTCDLVLLRGFAPELEKLKEELSSTFPCLPRENPGSLWPKTSLAALEEGRRLTPDQFTSLRTICRSIAFPCITYYEICSRRKHSEILSPGTQDVLPFLHESTHSSYSMFRSRWSHWMSSCTVAGER